MYLKTFLNHRKVDEKMRVGDGLVDTLELNNE